MTLKYDFHSHSIYSDGTLTPVELIDYAIERGVECLALTDHDTISGLREAQDYIDQNQLPIRLIKGLELSALTDYGEIHIVGLGVDDTDEHLLAALKLQQEKRWLRAKEIDRRLQKIGVNGVYEVCAKQVKQVVTRSHIARAIVELGYAKDLSQAFKKYIGKKGRIKVDKDWISLENAIEVIRKAHGIPVLAHPTRYPISNRKLGFLIQEFTENGGEAIELAYPSLSPDKMAWLKIHQESNNLLASCGSDFHYPDMRWTDLGRFPRIDANIPHVSERLI